MSADTATLTSFKGGCHCGAVSFDYQTATPSSAWSMRGCQCSFCRAHGGITTSDPQGVIEFHEATPGDIHRYRFGQKSADFLLCRHCGVYVGVTMPTDGQVYGIINTRALQPIPADLPAPQSKEYGAEGAEQRIARRTQLWSRVRDA